MPSFASLTRSPSLRRPVLSAAAAALFSQAACYSYRSVDPVKFPPAGDVRLALTREGTAELQPLLGPDVRRINGQVLELAGDTAAVVLIDELVTGDGSVLAWRRGRVVVPARVVASVEQRVLDRRRTKIFAAAATTTFIAVVVTAIKKAGSRGSSRTGPGSGPPE